MLLLLFLFAYCIIFENFFRPKNDSLVVSKSGVSSGGLCIFFRITRNLGFGVPVGVVGLEVSFWNCVRVVGIITDYYCEWRVIKCGFISGV